MSRDGPWYARPPTECARRPGASPLKRMAASWSGSNRTQPNTRSRREPSRAMAGSLGSFLFSAAATSALQPENLKRRFPAGPGLARGSQPSTPLRAAFAGGLRPVLTAAARRARWCLAGAKKRPLSTEQRNPRKGARWRRNQLDIQSPIQGSSVTSCRLILLILDFTTSASRRTNRCPRNSGAAHLQLAAECQELIEIIRHLLEPGLMQPRDPVVAWDVGAAHGHG